MQIRSFYTISRLLLLLAGRCGAAIPQQPAIAPYLLPDAPVFDLTLTQFRQHYNTRFPTTLLQEYRAINNESSSEVVISAATRISKNAYSSTALELGTSKIKSLQITAMLSKSRNGLTVSSLTYCYMKHLMQYFSPQYTEKQSQERLARLLAATKATHFVTENQGSVRYSVVLHPGKNLTFAVEPIRLTLRMADN